MFLFRDGGKICQYVVSRLHADGKIVYRIGEKDFEDMPALLEFYTTHYLDNTPLTESVSDHTILILCSLTSLKI